MRQGDEVWWFMVFTLALAALVFWPFTIPIGIAVAGEIMRMSYQHARPSYTPV
jgi:hypothetical protein